MANLDQKVAENIPGRYFVDATCIDCDLCRELAGNNFVRQEDEGYSYVRSQPSTEEEEAACWSAMEECPVEAIGIAEVG